MSNLQNLIYKWLYLVILMFFLLSIILFLSEFWIWGNIADIFPPYAPAGDKNYWIQFSLRIKDAFDPFFINIVFPTAVFTAILSCISILMLKKIKPSQNLPFVKFNMIEKLNLFTSIILKIITVYSALSWFSIPFLNLNEGLIFDFSYLCYYYPAVAPYFYTYFSLLTSISFLSYLGISRLEFRIKPYIKAGFISYYKN